MFYYLGNKNNNQKRKKNIILVIISSLAERMYMKNFVLAIAATSAFLAVSRTLAVRKYLRDSRTGEGRPIPFLTSVTLSLDNLKEAFNVRICSKLFVPGCHCVVEMIFYFDSAPVTVFCIFQEVAAILGKNDGIFAFLSPGDTVFWREDCNIFLTFFLAAGKPFVIVSNENVLNDVLIRNASR